MKKPRGRKRRRKECDGKVKHATREKAVSHLIFLKKEGRARMHVYKCSFCKQWHVGHIPHHILRILREKGIHS